MKLFLLLIVAAVWTHFGFEPGVVLAVIVGLFFLISFVHRNFKNASIM